MNNVILLSLFALTVTALQFSPRATPTITSNSYAQGFSPRPTQAPSATDLRKRQDFMQGLLVGPDQVCGYSEGLSNLEVDFCRSARCAFRTTPGLPGDIFCCNTIKCAARWSTCIDAADVYASSLCTTCSITIETLMCTETISGTRYPYCHTGLFSGVNVYAKYCDSTPFSTIDAWQTTYTNQIGRTFSCDACSTTSPTSEITSIATTTSSTPSPTSTPLPNPKPLVGAIAGGAVGGVAVIAAIIAVIFFIHRSKKARKDTTGGENLPEFIQDQSGGYNPYGSPPLEKSAAIAQINYGHPTYPTSQSPPPHQTYSPPHQYQQNFASPPVGGAYGHPQPQLPQELNSTSAPTSPRPDSEISTSQLPTYIPYQPPVPIYSKPTGVEGVIHEVL